MYQSVIAVILCISLGGVVETAVDQTAIAGSDFPQDTARVNALIDSSYALSYSEPDRAIAFADTALKLAEILGYTKGVARAHRELGYSNGVKGNFEVALEHHQKGVAGHRQIDDTLGVISQLNDIGNLYKRQSLYEKSLNYFFQALELSEQEGIDRATGSIVSNIGLSFFELDEVDKAEEFYHRALEINKRLDDRHGLSINYNNLGLLYSDIGEYEEALQYHFNALTIRRELGYTIRIANSLNNIGRTYMQQDQYEEAVDYLGQALDVNEGRDPELTSIIHENLARVYFSSGQLDSALVYAEKTLELSLDYGSLLGEKVSHELLKDIYKAMGDYEQAFVHQQEVMVVKDSILNEEKARQISELQTKYETAQKEKEIVLLEKENQRETLMRNAFLVGLVLVLIIGLLIYNRQRLMINKNRTELENQRLKEQQLQQDLEFRNRQLTNHTLHLVQKNETMKELKERITDMRKKNGAAGMQLQKLENMVDYSFNLDEDWEQFRMYFEQIHSGFFDALKEQYPDLTPNELRLAALAKLNLSIKETATIMGITPDSVKTARYRLRKKLEMETEENLTEFLMDLEAVS